MEGTASAPTAPSPPIPGADLLLRLSALTHGPVLQRRFEILKCLVCASLSQKRVGDKFSARDVVAGIRTLARCSLTEEAVVGVLERLAAGDNVRHSEGLEYSVVRPFPIPAFSDLTAPAWHDFVEFATKTKVEYDPYIDAEARNCFDQVVRRIFSKFASTLSTDTTPFDLLPIEDFRAVVSQIVDKSGLPDRRKAPIAKAIVDFLKTDSPRLRSLVYEAYTGLINIDIVRREQELPAVEFIDSLRFFLLDTSLIVTLLCSSDPAHGLAQAVVREARRRGVPLCYAEETKAELGALIFGTRKLAASLTLAGHSGVLKNQFIIDFQKSGMEWSDYFAHLSTWPDRVRGEWGIAALPRDIDLTVDESTYDLVLRMLPILNSLRNEERQRNAPERMPRARDEEQFEHDAFCLGLLANQRKSVRAQSGQAAMGPWLVTFDKIVTAMNPYFQKEFGLELVMQPRVALNYFLAYSRIEFAPADRDEVAEAILQYTARIPDPKLTLSEYLRLLTYRVGLEKGDVETVRRVFLQHPLREELEKALEQGRTDVADETAYKVITNEPFVASVISERQTQQKLKRAGQAVAAEHERYEKERAAREALERVVGKPVSITVAVNAQITINIKAQLEHFAGLLEAEGAFGMPDFPKPTDLSTTPMVRGWLQRVSDWIGTHPGLGTGIAALAPLVAHLLQSIPT